MCVAQAHTTDFYGAPASSVFEDSILSPYQVRLGEYWRLLTSGFLHLSLIHIGVNMISLYILGMVIEPILGKARYLLVYLTALFGGSAAVVALTPAHQETAGASGAIYGLMGAMLVIVLKLKAPPGQVIAIIVVNLVISFSVPGISLYGHLGGLLFGTLATAAALYVPELVMGQRAPTVESRRRAVNAGWAAMVALLVVAILLGALAPHLRA
ncbi:rhomboid family intramembrane serine protease [Gordonia sp. (in: high G+C Gram-positive bacteria)]|uniref:rhomboid family intramembrane serine protease n=1 Tax=Gordonia sp. (in: high G+C Gram-positive bacteria) TaxID=84139 RepID=UPI0039E481DF